MELVNSLLTINKKEKNKTSHLIILVYYFFLPLGFFLLFFSLSGCKNDMVDFSKYAKNQQGAEWCLPILNDKLTILDIINDSLNVTSNEEGLISIIYSSEVLSPLILENLDIPEIDTSNEFTFEIPEYVPSGDSIFIPFSQNIIFDILPNQRIKTIKFNSCHLLLTFNSDLNRDATIVLSIPGALKNGEPYSTTIHYTYDEDITNTLSKEIDLSDYEVHLSHQEQQYNIMKITFESYVYSNTEANNSSYFFDIHEYISNISISKFIGYVGNIDFTFSIDTLSVEIFKEHVQGTIQFQNPIINLIARNSIGAPVSLNNCTIKAIYNDPFIEPVNIEGPGLPNEWFIYYPNIENNTAVSKLTLDAENSNVKEVLNSAPDKLIITASGMLNPESITIDNFINDKSKITLLTELKLQLYGSTSNLILKNDYDFNFEKVQDIQSSEFSIIFSNAFPIDLKLQIYFINKSDNVLDSLFTDSKWIKRGAVDHNNSLRMINPTETVLRSYFNQEKMNRIKYETTNIRVKAQLDTPADTPVKIYSYDYLGFHIGIKYQN